MSHITMAMLQIVTKEGGERIRAERGPGARATERAARSAG